jgi:pyruvate/2-oxoglutarate dehydrogenase complex dihydrolipoamide acyltransferase (E2) component
METVMLVVKVDEELWASNILPEGLLERWRAHDGQKVEAGEPLAEVRIEDAVHEIVAPGAGVLVHTAGVGDVVQPGDRLGWVAPADPAKV